MVLPFKVKLSTGEILDNEFNSEDELKKFCFQNNISNYQVERKLSSFIKSPYIGSNPRGEIPVDRVPPVKPVFFNQILPYKLVGGLYKPPVLYKKYREDDENL